MRYKVTLNDLENRHLLNILRSIKIFFSSILKDIIDFKQTDDLVRLSI